MTDVDIFAAASFGSEVGRETMPILPPLRSVPRTSRCFAGYP